MGYISLQPKDSYKTTQKRILKSPTTQEITKVTLKHIHHVDKTIVSFGQNYEKKPLLRNDTIKEAIQLIHKETNKKTIHLNNNASLPLIMEKLYNTGLQSLQINMNSTINQTYNRYYNPQNYTFNNIRENKQIITQNDGFLSLNLLMFPNINDTENKLITLEKFIEDTNVDMIQIQNLNVDPKSYITLLKTDDFGPNINFLTRKPMPNPKPSIPNNTI